MGAVFKLHHANLMAYLTSSSPAPRTSLETLREFLEVLCYGHDYLISEMSSSDWELRIRENARHALQMLEENLTTEGNFTTTESYTEMMTVAEDVMIEAFFVDTYLQDLRREFSYPQLFALAIGDKNSRVYREAIRIAQISTTHRFLVLIPEVDSRETKQFEVLDPIPVFSTALDSISSWPGFLFWTRDGNSTFVPLMEGGYFLFQAMEIFDRQQHDFYSPSGLDNNLNYLFQQYRDKQVKNKKILHLSDLHFGTDYANRNQRLLTAQIQNVVNSIDRIVITGDLMDSPNDANLNQFQNFNDTITNIIAGIKPISITGNHDQRWMGIIGNNYQHITQLRSSGIEIDDNLKIVFLILNSSIGGRLAQGEVTIEQLTQVGTELLNAQNRKPEIKCYLRILLIHHHPFPYEANPKTTLQRFFQSINFLNEQNSLSLTDADLVHNWCVDWNIATILHGHKHKPRCLTQNISHQRRSLDIMAIGCGSSLGAEGSPVTYNLLEWNPEKRIWHASFFESINGGAFRQTYFSASL